MPERLARSIVRNPRRALIAAVVVVLVLSVGLTRTRFRTDQGTLVDSQSQVFRDNVRYQDRFGGEQVLILLTGDPVALFTRDGGTEVRSLEARVRATDGVSAVIGPYGAVTYARDQLGVAPQLLGAAATRAPQKDAYDRHLSSEIGRLTASGAQDLTNPDFVRFLLFTGDGSIRASQKASFPDAHHALIVAQLDGNASIEAQGRAATAIGRVVDGYHFAGHQVLVAGTPALLGEINDYLKGGMASLGALAVVVMVAILWLAFRVRWRLLPLAVMAVGTAAAIGAAGLAGIDLTLVTISGLPIFIGLGVDFAIQVHNRYVEERDRGADAEAAAATALEHMAPPLVVAMVAGGLGFLALLLSSVPMIRDFGVLLCLGVVILVVGAIVLPATLLVLVDRHRTDRPDRPGRPVASGSGVLERAVGRATRLHGGVLAITIAVGSVAAVGGLVVEGRTAVDTEVEHWVSPHGHAVRSLDQLRAQTGFSSVLGVMVEAPDVTSDEVVAWVDRFEQAELERHPHALLQVSSASEIAGDVVGLAPTGSDVRTLLEVAPADIQRSLVTGDHRAANIQFSIGDLTLDERGRVVDAIEADLRGDLTPPKGVTVTPSGLAVSGKELVDGLKAGRRSLTLLALGLVALWLLVRGRLRPRALLPVVPVAFAVGAASAVLWGLGFELTPLTTVAAPLVIAVATEFTVLLQARYDQERAAGRTPASATAELPKIGRAFVASGLTLAGGFAILGASPMPLLRDFGVVVAIDVAIALASALVLMPALLRWADRGASSAAMPPVAAHTAPPPHPPRRSPLHAAR